MLGVGGVLLFQQLGFGLFKLSMYIQPFLMSIFVLMISQYFYREKQWIFLVVAILLLHGKISYVVNSLGEFGNIRITHFSSSNIDEQLRNKIPKDLNVPILIHAANLSLGKLQTLYTRGHFAFYAAGCNFLREMSILREDMVFFPKTDDSNGVKDFGCRKNQDQFYLPGYEDKLGKITASDPLFFIHELSNKNNMVLLSSNNNFTNRLTYNPDENGKITFQVIPLEKIQNYLINIFSEKSLPFYLQGFRSSASIAYSSPDRDGFYPDKTIVKLRRWNIFQLLAPSSQPRVMLNVSATFNAQGQQKLPPVKLIGAKEQILDVVGYGSARIFSPVIEPYVRKAQDYLVLDLGKDGEPVGLDRKGLMQLYGKQILSNREYPILLARDISVIDESFYKALDVPTHIMSFPQDLQNPALEYSGLYEDGWVGDQAYIVLKQASGAHTLLIEGEVPALNDDKYQTTLQVVLDGQEIERQILKVGHFSVKINVDVSKDQRHRVELRFSNLRTMPDKQERPVTALLQYVGFKNE